MDIFLLFPPPDPSERNVRFASLLDEENQAWNRQLIAENVVMVMTEFAFDLLRIIYEIGAVKRTFEIPH